MMKREHSQESWQTERGSAGEGTGTFVPGVGVKGTPVWGEEEGKEMKGRGEPEEDGTGMRSRMER